MAVVMGQMIRGNKVAESITEELIRKVKMIGLKGLRPKLVIVKAGENESDRAYETGALSICGKIGIQAEVKLLGSDISEEDFIKEIIKLNGDDSVNGILILRPLPRHIKENKIKHIISKEKDVDCFNPLNVANVMEYDKNGFVPCTSAAVIEILKHYKVPMAGKRAAVLGSSMVVGKPVSMMLVNENSTLTMCDINTNNNAEACSKADIVVVAIGKSKLIGSEYIKHGAVVIDVGINVDEEGNISGDVDIDQVKDKVSMISPVPGGVGLVTISILAMHVVKACYQQNGMMYI